MTKKKKYLSPIERLKIVQKHTRHFYYIKYFLFITFICSIFFFIYLLWLKDLFFTEPKGKFSVFIPTKREVLERRMVNPEYLSYDKTQNPFSILAKTSHKIDKDHFFLTFPDCKSLKKGDSPITLRSNKGILQESTKILDLKGNVILKKEDVTFTTNSLHFDTKLKEGYGNEPIKGVSSDKKITAGAFQIKDEGSTFCFQQGNQKERPTLILETKAPNA